MNLPTAHIERIKDLGYTDSEARFLYIVAVFSGFHYFRRFRTSLLRKNRVPWDLEKFWIGHASKDVTDKYAEQLKEDVEYRREWAERVGLSFVVPRVPQLNVVSVQQHAA